MNPYRILERKRMGEALGEDEIAALVDGASSGSWSDAQLGAFLMAAAIQGMSAEETETLTRSMLESGERWDLAADIPNLLDKHSTGGVGDKVSLLLAPLLASCDLPVVMLTGRGLGHTGGTADKLESMPGLQLELDRPTCLRSLQEHGFAIGVATAAIAPADRRLYALRDGTATVSSLPLIVSSILSKKLAAGAAGIVFDVKTGEGAFLPEESEARRLAKELVETTERLGRRASALLTDMSEPLGRWSGNLAEVREVYDCFAGRGEPRLLEVTFRLCEEMADLLGASLERGALEEALASGRVRERFERWALGHGAERSWIGDPDFGLAPVEVAVEAERAGVLAKVHTRQLGLLLSEAGAGRAAPGEAIDPGIALDYRTRLGAPVEEGEELARLYLRRADDDLAQRLRGCFEIAETGRAPNLVRTLTGG